MPSLKQTLRTPPQPSTPQTPQTPQSRLNPQVDSGSGPQAVPNTVPPTGSAVGLAENRMTSTEDHLIRSAAGSATVTSLSPLAMGKEHSIAPPSIAPPSIAPKGIAGLGIAAGSLTSATSVTAVGRQSRLKVATRLHRALGNVLSSVGARQLTPQQAKRLTANSKQLQKLLTHGQLRNPQQLQTLGQAYLTLKRDFSLAGLGQSNVSSSLPQEGLHSAMVGMRDAMINKIGDDFGIVFTPQLLDDTIIALSARTSAHPTAARQGSKQGSGQIRGQVTGKEESIVAPALSSVQQQVLATTRQFIYEAGRLNSLPEHFSGKHIPLLQARDALSQYMLSSNLSGQDALSLDGILGLQEGAIKSDIDFTSSALVAMDTLLRQGKPMDAGVSSAFTALANTLNLHLASQGLDQLGLRINRLALHQTAIGSTQLNTQLGQGIAALGHSLGGLNSTLGVGFAVANQGVQGIEAASAAQIAQPNTGLSATLTSAAAAYLATPPAQTSQTATQAVEQFTNQTNQSTQAAAANGILLPIIPMTQYILPTPIEYDDGNGNILNIPAGASLSQTAEGGHVVDTPGLTMQTPGASFVAGHSIINLGPNQDSLSLGSLIVNTGSDNAQLTGTSLTLDKVNNQAMFSADNAQINLLNGDVNLSGVILNIDGGGAQLSTGSLIGNWGNDNLAIESVNGSQTTGPMGTSFTQIAASGLSLTSGGQLLTADNISLDLVQNSDGSQQSSYVVQGLSVVSGGQTILSENAQINIDQNSDGSSSLGVLGDFSLQTSSGGMVGGADSSGSTTDITGGLLNMAFDADGQLSTLDFSAEGLSMSGTGANGIPNALQTGAVNGSLVAVTSPDGTANGQVLHLDASDASFNAGGREISFASLQGLDLTTGPNGEMQQLNVLFDGPVQLVDANAGQQFGFSSLGLEYSAANSTQGASASLQFTDANIHMLTEGVVADVATGGITTNETGTHLFLTDAHLTQALNGTLAADLTIDALDFTLNTSPEGVTTGAAMELGNATVLTELANVMVRTPEGERLRLAMTMSEDGQQINGIFLQANGSEIELTDNDGMHMVLSPGAIALTQDADGVVNFNAEELGIVSAFGDTQINFDSERLDISLDPDRGLVFNEITGTNIAVQTAGQNININIAALDNLILQVSGVEGAAQGGTFSLTPSGDGESEFTAQFSTMVEGIPITLDFANLRELQGIATLAENDFRLVLADTTGEGNIVFQVGDFSLQGSAIGLHARYREFESGRALQAIDGLFNDHYLKQLTDNIAMTPNRAILGTAQPNETGFGFATSLEVLLPKEARQPAAYLLGVTTSANQRVDTGGMGGIAKVGVNYTSESGTTTTSSLFVGVMPGAYLDIDIQGKATYKGITLPSNIDIPSTVIAGVDIKSKEVNGDGFGVTVGGFANPVAFAPTSGMLGENLREDTAGGIFGHVDYNSGDYKVKGQALVGVDKEGKQTDTGFSLSIGLTF